MFWLQVDMPLGRKSYLSHYDVSLERKRVFAAARCVLITEKF